MLGPRCINVIQILCVFWDGPVPSIQNIRDGKKGTSDINIPPDYLSHSYVTVLELMM